MSCKCLQVRQSNILRPTCRVWACFPDKGPTTKNYFRPFFIIIIITIIVFFLFWIFNYNFEWPPESRIFFVGNKISVLISNLFYYGRRCRCCCCCIICSFSPLCWLSNIILLLLLLYRVPHRLQYHNIQVKRNIIIIVLRKNMEVKEYVRRVKVSLVNLAKLNRVYLI